MRYPGRRALHKRCPHIDEKHKVISMNTAYLQPIRHKLISLTGGAIDSIKDASTGSWIVEGPMRQTLRPGMYHPEDLDHVTGSWEGTTVQREVDFLKGGIKEHAPTVAFKLRDVSVISGALYSGRWRERLLTRDLAQSGHEPLKLLRSGVVACTWSGNHFFGHWITDDLTLYLAAREIGNPFILKRRPYLHEPEYRQLLNIPYEPIARAHFDEVIILQDFGQNSYKRRRYEFLRRWLREKVQPAGAKRVLLRRGNLGQRRAIVNALEFESYLTSQGFSIVEPEKLTPTEIAEKTLGAEVVIGVEGSQIPHALLTMADGGILCCVQPPSRFNNTIKGYTDCLDMQYAILVGRPDPGGFSIDMGGLKLMLERFETALAHR